MIEETLQSTNTLLEGYGIDFIFRHATDHRDLGISAFSRAISDPRTTPETKLLLGFNLSDPRLFVSGSADTGNQMIVSTLATGLVQEQDPQRQMTWATLLANAVLGPHSDNQRENSKIQSALAHAPKNPPADRVLSALTAVAARVTKDEKSRLLRLEQVWQSR
jgi:hypothetical protein